MRHPHRDEHWDIETIRRLYLDIDHDGRAALAKIQQSTLLPSLNYTVNASPDKFQVIWRVENVSQEQAELLQRVMARKFGGDPAATDSTRVLRLPGSHSLSIARRSLEASWSSFAL